MPWYQGPTLIELLESLSVYDESHDAPFRFPVQLVARHNGHEANDFRGYMGRIEAGQGQRGRQAGGAAVAARARPSRTSSPSTVRCESAVAGQSVTLLLNEYLDISRGDMLAGGEQPGHAAEDR